MNVNELSNTELLQSKTNANIIIKVQDKLVDATWNINKTPNLKDILPTDINKTGGLTQELENYVDAKAMLRSNINVA